MPHVLRFLDGKVRQDHVDGIVSEVVVGKWYRSDRQGKAKIGESRESEMERKDTCANTSFHDTGVMRVCDTHEDVRNTQ